MCSKAPSASTIWKTWKCQWKFEIKFQCPTLSLPHLCSHPPHRPGSHLPLLLPLLLFPHFLLLFFSESGQPLHCGTGRGVTSYSLKPTDVDGDALLLLRSSMRCHGLAVSIPTSSFSFPFLRVLYPLSSSLLLHEYTYAAAGWDNALTSKIVS